MQEKNKFRYTEKCLYEYKRNIAALDVLREDLRVEQAGVDVHAQSYQLNFSFNSEPSNPVEARLIKIENLEHKIKTLERFTKPVTQLMSDLDTAENLEGSDNELLLNILKLLYFGKNTVDAVLCELHIAPRTFTRKRRELVFMASSYLAF
ncbi:MAG: hypothetical protein IJ859_13220 [Synergistaceae bacterium]|nr:hypothetical protein [Synergistaceae bacterium]